MSGGKGSLEETPTWAVSVICLSFFVVSMVIDAGASRLSKFFRSSKRKSLNRALRKIKTEMMIMGFISLLLTISEVPISKICVTEAVASSFLPCEDTLESEEPTAPSTTQLSSPNSTTEISTTITDETYCEVKGMVSLMSRDGTQQLKIFISFLAVFHILYSILMMLLGLAKMKKWEVWEEETQTLGYQIENDTRRFKLACQTSFGQRHLRFWSKYTVLLWLVSFMRQFSGSVPKADYFTLRNGFISVHLFEGGDFNFQKFLTRVFDDDFEKVVGISFWIWIYPIFFIFLSAHVFYNHYWLPFIPLMIVLVIGTKLEVIITKMCLESGNKNSVTQGTFVVKPDNKFFWFGRPEWILHLLQFILFQNSFQLAFFLWTWYEYGPRSCFNRETEDIAIRVVMSVVVQFLCGYVTLPLYALVTQMGSGMKPAIFTERVAKGLKRWRKLAVRNLQTHRDASSTTRRNSSTPFPTETTDTSFSETQSPYSPNYDCLHHLSVSISQSDPKITEITEMQQNQNAIFAVNSNADLGIPQKEIITRGAYDGEISFASTWKESERSKDHQGEIVEC